MTFWKRAQVFNPALVRLLARHRYGRPMTDDEIVKAVSGLTHFELQLLCKRTNWDGVPVDTMQLYLVGCHCDFENASHMRYITDYLRRDPTFAYLRRDAAWKTFYLPLLLTWIRSAQHITWPPIKKLLVRLQPLTQR